MNRNEEVELLEKIESFLDDSLILEVLRPVHGGKEASIFLCRAAPSTGRQHLAVKVYRSMARRVFRNDGLYQQGRVILNQRARRAYENHTDFGKEVQYARWVNAEYETQRMLYDSGADVPRPWACNGNAILMDWVGDDATGAPAIQLRHARFASRDEAERLCDSLLSNVALMLRLNVIHGDLSPFNVLYESTADDVPSRVTLIDFPQAVDPRANRHACELLFRDVTNVCEFFMKFGVRRDAGRIAGQLWERFVYARL
jgi:RIO kinase 1